MNKSEHTISIRSMGSHGWELVAICTPQSYEYVFKALCVAYPTWQIMVENSKGDLITSLNYINT